MVSNIPSHFVVQFAWGKFHSELLSSSTASSFWVVALISLRDSGLRWVWLNHIRDVSALIPPVMVDAQFLRYCLLWPGPSEPPQRFWVSQFCLFGFKGAFFVKSRTLPHMVPNFPLPTPKACSTVNSLLCSNCLGSSGCYINLSSILMSKVIWA